MPSDILSKLLEAETMAWQLLEVAEKRNLFVANQTEKGLSTALYDIAFELFGIKQYWHKRIVRSGKNTLLPYRENPPDLTIQNDDILFVDFGPVFEKWEADIGKTYVVGNDPHKLKLKNDVELVWIEGRDFYMANKEHLTGADFYNHTKQIAQKYGWTYGNIHCGHLIGEFPHEVIAGEKTINYIHPENSLLMSAKYTDNTERYWIYEVHLIDEQNEIGAFYEKVLC